MKSGYIKSGSANIYYEIYGEQNREIIVLLHGNGESIEKFNKLIPLLETNYKVVAVDSRGHGKSEFGRAELSLGAMVIDLENVLIDLGYSRVNIVGFSDGANIGMLFAIKNPDMVKKLVLIGGNYNFRGLTLSTRAMIFIGYWCSVLGGAIDSRNRLNKEYLALMYKEPKLKKSTLKAIKSDTLVIVGNKDMIKISHAKSMAEAIPKAKLKIVEGNHFWVYTNSSDAARVINSFLENIR